MPSLSSFHYCRPFLLMQYMSTCMSYMTGFNGLLDCKGVLLYSNGWSKTGGFDWTNDGKCRVRRRLWKPRTGSKTAKDLFDRPVGAPWTP